MTLKHFNKSAPAAAGALLQDFHTAAAGISRQFSAEAGKFFYAGGAGKRGLYYAVLAAGYFCQN